MELRKIEGTKAVVQFVKSDFFSTEDFRAVKLIYQTFFSVLEEERQVVNILF